MDSWEGVDLVAWSTPPTWSVGEDITAADLQIMSDDLNALWTQPFARKTATESVTSSTTLQNDDELLVSVEANTTYVMELFMAYDGATGGDIKIGFTVPASTTGRLIAAGLTSTAAAYSDDQTSTGTLATVYSFGAVGTGTDAGVLLKGVVVTAGTAGTLQVQWAQLASSGTATRVFSSSYLALRRVA